METSEMDYAMRILPWKLPQYYVDSKDSMLATQVYHRGISAFSNSPKMAYKWYPSLVLKDSIALPLQLEGPPQISGRVIM